MNDQRYEIFHMDPPKTPDKTSGQKSDGQEIKERIVRKVLVVDDDKAVREGIVDLLKICGYEVVEASSGEEALIRLSENEDIDAVLSDKDMGDMSGVDLLENIHKNMLSRNMILILQTGNPESNIRQRLTAIGAAYLQKPYELEDLEKIFKQK